MISTSAEGQRQARNISTTIPLVRTLVQRLVKTQGLWQGGSTYVPDEARTFGMEGMFRQLGIYSSQGPGYTHPAMTLRPDSWYLQGDKSGQILEEGINEAGAFSAWLRHATSYQQPTPADGAFYNFLFHVLGSQRIMDLGPGRRATVQAAGGFLMSTAVATTLNRRRLQHQDVTVT